MAKKTTQRRRHRPEEALETGLQHIEFDSVEDLYALAQALRECRSNPHGDLPEGKVGCTISTPTAPSTSRWIATGVLVAVHEFAHVCRRKERDDHGAPSRSAWLGSFES